MDNINNNIYNKQSLSLLNIRDLRDMGRSLGVPSPTTKSKDELIDYILKIIYGEITVVARTNRGRPNTRECNMDKYVTEIGKRSIMTPGMLPSMSDECNFSLKLASPRTKTDLAEIKQYVFVKDDTDAYFRVHAFVESECDIKVSSETEIKYGLENFDVIEMYECKGIFKIVSINGKKLENKFEKLDVLDHDFTNGGSQVFHLSTKEEIIKEIKNIDEVCTKKHIKCLLLASEIDQNITAETVTFSESDDSSQIYKQVIKYVALVEKCLYKHEDIVCIVKDIESIETAIKSFDEEIKNRIKKHLQEKQELLTKLGNVLLVFRLDNIDITY